MSTILGLISIISIGLAIYFAYQNNGIAPMQYGAVVILSLMYSMTGVVLGILSYKEQDIFKLFPVIGIILNIVALLAGMTIFGLGSTIR